MTQVCPYCGCPVPDRVFSLRGYCSRSCYIATKNAGARLGGDPTPEEIAEMTAAIRALWSEEEHYRRAFAKRHGHGEPDLPQIPQPWTPPESRGVRE